MFRNAVPVLTGAMKTKTRKTTRQRNQFDGTAGEATQILGSPEAMMSGRPPVLRRLEPSDIIDDCEICRSNRALLDAGRPPMVWVYE